MTRLKTLRVRNWKERDMTITEVGGVDQDGHEPTGNDDVTLPHAGKV
jgi:hypothetical protein